MMKKNPGEKPRLPGLTAFMVEGALVLAVAGFFGTSSGLLGCQHDTGSTSNVIDEGFETYDSNLVIDNFRYSSAACAEVLPAAFTNADSIPMGSAAAVLVVS